MQSFALILLLFRGSAANLSQQEAEDPMEFIADQVVAKLVDRALQHLPLGANEDGKIDETTLRKSAPQVPRRHMAKMMAAVGRAYEHDPVDPFPAIPGRRKASMDRLLKR
eukprot:gnl/MRDRNA2_/MRDRNA2_110471_c0_seq1.p2 gnl/MRDRNA2_/MRDRNA2_110471_c0~~gnl/MRDRNA2_/MRDRNA2_110471_c0_seq1.p2  ORF type:complete len:110 (-),score=25.84 gnl/MRDRNA2_/MRDRNA2_110471_c0_seq1:18-347(-)